MNPGSSQIFSIKSVLVASLIEQPLKPLKPLTIILATQSLSIKPNIQSSKRLATRSQSQSTNWSNNTVSSSLSATTSSHKSGFGSALSVVPTGPIETVLSQQIPTTLTANRAWRLLLLVLSQASKRTCS